MTSRQLPPNPELRSLSAADQACLPDVSYSASVNGPARALKEKTKSASPLMPLPTREVQLPTRRSPVRQLNATRSPAPPTGADGPTKHLPAKVKPNPHTKGKARDEKKRANSSSVRIEKKKIPRTRGEKSAAAIVASINDGKHKDAGAGDAAADEGSDSEPEPLNADECTTTPHCYGDRYYFADPSQVPHWPVVLALSMPFVVLLYLLQNHLEVFCCLAFVYSHLQFPLVYWLGAWVERRDYVNWFRASSLPPGMNGLPSVDDCCELHHTRPEYSMHARFWTSVVWILQCVASVLLDTTSVVTGVAYHWGRETEALVFEDNRLPNHQGNKPVPNRVVYDKYTVASFSTGLASVRIVCEALARQFIPRLLPLSPADQRLQAENMATRVSNLHIRGSYSPEVARGSADAAVAHCTSAAVSSNVFRSAYTMATWTLEFPAFTLFLFGLLAFFPWPRATASMTAPELYGWIWAIVAAPLLEELVKDAINFVTGCGRPAASILFGAWELAISSITPNLAIVVRAIRVFPFFVHVAVGFQHTRVAILMHYTWNIMALAFFLYGSSLSEMLPVWRVTDGLQALHTPAIPRTNWVIFTNDTIQFSEPHPVKWWCPEERFWIDDMTFLEKYASYDPICGVLASNPDFRHEKKHVDMMLHSCPWFAIEGCLAPKLPHDPFETEDNSAGTAASPLAFIIAGISVVAMAISLATAPPTPDFGQPWHAIGYRQNEVTLPPVPAHTASVTLLPGFFEPSPRLSACTSLGFTLADITPPFPDFGHAPTVLHGCLLRFCKTPPTPAPGVLRKLRRFVSRYVKKHYVPLPPDADVTFETWLAGTDYPEWRKEELRRVWVTKPWCDPKDKDNKSFAKKEHYTDYKPARGINSRSDSFKCATGPYFKLIESQLYAQPCFDGVGLVPGEQGPFIKHIPVHLRPAFIERMLGAHSGPYYETDYSQFEKHFTPEVMRSLEIILYRHMLQHHPAASDLICRTLTGRNKCIYRGFIIKILGKRMSGDMCTSLGNGFSNLMLFMFCAHSKGGRALGIVEGDDALFVSTVPLDATDFARVGFDIKVAIYENLYSTAFCGMLMSQDGIILRDINRVIPKFGWTFSPRRFGGPRVRLGLLRARALSLAYESPRCPIICALARRALALTYGFKPIFDYSFHGQQLAGWAQLFEADMLRSLAMGPTLQARVDFAEKFHISVPLQLRAEELIAEWDGKPCTHPLLNGLFDAKADMYDFTCRFVARSLRDVNTIGDTSSA